MGRHNANNHSKGKAAYKISARDRDPDAPARPPFKGPPLPPPNPKPPH